VCNRENLDQFKFCGFCGSNLEGKIKCSKCKEWVDGNFSFCPHCSNKLKAENEAVKGKMSTFQKNKLNAIITNSLVISLCLGLFFILFAGIGIKKLDISNDDTFKFSINFLDVCEATFNDITRYSMEDYREDMSRFTNDGHTRDFKSVNLLNALAIEDIFTIQTVFLYIIFILVISMMVIPLVSIGFAIYNLSNLKYKKDYKKYFIVSLLLGFILLFLLREVGFKAGVAVILYIIFSSMGLIYSLIIELINRTRIFNPKLFTLKLISSIFLIILILLTTANIGVLGSDGQGVKSAGLNYADYTIIINEKTHLGTPVSGFMGLSDLKYYFPMLYNSSDMTKHYNWSIYVALLIPLFMIIVAGLLITTLGFETVSNTLERKKKNPTLLLLWLALAFEIIIIVLFIITTTCFNQSYKYLYKIEEIQYLYKINISAGIIILTFFTIITVVYQTIVNKILKKASLKTREY